MAEIDLQDLCERGQVELMETRYLAAVATLAYAEEIAWKTQAFDTLSRLYLPLQETRRQIRQRCGEGRIQMHLFPVDQAPTACAHGQLLVGGWGSVAPAIELRRLVLRQQIYLETFLAAIYPVTNAEPVVVIVPLAESPLPTPEPRSIDQLRSLLPPRCLLFTPEELPPDVPAGTADSFAAVMAIWEKLHLPFLMAADQEIDPIRRMQAYRLTLQVDPACELAHQHLADVGRKMARQT